MKGNSDFFSSLETLHYVCLQQNIAFVSYRLPAHAAITTLVQYNTAPEIITDIAELNAAEGYIVFPFCEQQGFDAFLLQPDLEFKDNNVSADMIAGLSRIHFPDKTTFDDFIETTSRTEFENNVNTAVRAIKNNELRKVVISKTQVVEISEHFSASRFYQKLCTTYPNAYIYFFNIPGAGCWLGATPEALLTTENESMYTVSLAGTQTHTGLALEQYIWSEKELEEQDIVTNFIAQTLTENGIKHFSKSKVENYIAGNLIHLKSGFEFRKDFLKNDISKLLTALQPTPSTGGLPKTNAHDFILDTEKHNRSYYTGFLGTVHPEAGCQLYVNLRCMQLFSQKIVLYSGAGITASSVAENEWFETENKLDTLKKVIISP